MLGRFRRVVVMAGAGVLAALVFAGSALAAPGSQEGGDHASYADVFLTRLAALLNVEKDTLVASMKQAARDTVDEAESNGDLSPNQADRIRQRIESGDSPRMHVGMAHPNGRRLASPADWQAIMDAVAQRLGMTTEELQRELRAGKTPHRIAREHGVSDEDVKATVLDVVRPRLAGAVQRGDLSQKQADRVVAQIENADLDLAFSFGSMGRGFHGDGCPMMPSAGAGQHRGG